jgi:hypothetical protein
VGGALENVIGGVSVELPTGPDTMRHLLFALPNRGPASHASALVLLTIVIALFRPALLAQTSTSAIVQGHVRGTGGAVIPRAHLELLHEPTGALRRIEAGDDGHYIFAGVRVGGPYTLRVTHIGFKPQIRTGINLGPFGKVQVDLVLQQTDLSASEVVVTGTRTEPLTKETAGISLRVDRSQLDALSRASGSLEDAQRLSPYMAGGSALGFNRMYNELSLDGIDIGDSFGLQHGETLPGGMAASPL